MRPRRLPAVLLPAVLLLALAASACVSSASPEGWAAPVPADDVLLVSLDRGKLTALTFPGPLRANEAWTFPSDSRESDKDLDTEAIYASPLVDGNRVFVATHAEGVFALDLADGSTLWHAAELGDALVSAFLRLPSGPLAAGTSDGRLHLLDPETGDPIAGWPTDGIDLGADIWAHLAADDDSLYVATMDGTVHALDPETGTSRWAAPFRADGAILDLALLPNGTLFVPSLDRNVYLVDAESGAQRAAIPVADWVWMQPATTEGTIYFGDLAGELYAVDITTGALLWRSSLGARIKSPPALVGGILLVVDRSPMVHFIDPSTGSPLNSVLLEAKTVRAPVYVDGDTALILSTKGELFRANPVQLSVVPVVLGGGQ